MPTGYTAKLYSGEQSVEDFILDCTRAFMGELRETAMGSPIPKKFTPSEYHKNKLVETKKELKALLRMSTAAKLEFGVTARVNALEDITKSLVTIYAVNNRLSDMVSKIQSWNEPSDFTGFKNFLLEQLRISFERSEYYERHLQDIQERSPMHYYKDAVGKCESDITYHLEEDKKEREIADKNTKWIQGLRKSIKNLK